MHVLAEALIPTGLDIQGWFRGRTDPDRVAANAANVVARTPRFCGTGLTGMTAV